MMRVAVMTAGAGKNLMSEIRGIVRNPKTLQTDGGAKLMFGLIPAQGREVPVESPTGEDLREGDEVIVTGTYDNEGTLKAQAVNKIPKPPTPPAQPNPGKLRIRRMLLAAVLGEVAALFVTILLYAGHFITDNAVAWILYLLLAGAISFLLGRMFLTKELRTGAMTEKRRKENARLAGILAVAVSVVIWLLLISTK
jgi:hypothetical protein